MVLNKRNTPYTVDGIQYEIGKWYQVVGNNPYSGLQCLLREIRDGDDKVTENPGTDFICDCLVPSEATELAKFEAQVSAAYGAPRKAKDISLDGIIFSCDMLRGSDKLPACFAPETDTKYPLCVRTGFARCSCCLWKI